MPPGGWRRSGALPWPGGFEDDLLRFAEGMMTRSPRWELRTLDMVHAALEAIVDRHKRRGDLGEHVWVRPPAFLRAGTGRMRRLPDIEGCTFWIEDGHDRPGLSFRLSR